MLKFLYSTLLVIFTTTFLIAQGCDTCLEADNLTNGCKPCDPSMLATGINGRLPDCLPPCAPITDGSQPPALCGTGNFVPNNMVWYSFVASSESLSVSLDVSNCAMGLGMQLGIYSSCDWDDCVAFTPNCTITGEEFEASFIIGQTYYLFLDGCNGDACDYVLRIQNIRAVPLPEIEAITAYSFCRDNYLSTIVNGSNSGLCDLNKKITVCKGEEIEFSVLHKGDIDNPIDIHAIECNTYSEDLDADFQWSTTWDGDYISNPYRDGGFLPPLFMPDLAGTYQLCLNFIDYECDPKVGPVCLEIEVVDDLGIVYYQDRDGDGFGGGPGVRFSCDVPDGYVCLAGDCNDDDPTTVDPDNLPPPINLECTVDNDTVIYSWDELPGYNYEKDYSLLFGNSFVNEVDASVEITGFSSPCQYAIIKIIATAPNNPDCNIRTETKPCRISIDPPIEISNSVSTTTFRACENHSIIVGLRAVLNGVINPAAGQWEPTFSGSAGGFTFGNNPTFNPSGLAPGVYSAQFTYTNPTDGCTSSFPYSFTITSCGISDCDNPDDPNYPAACEKALEIVNVTTTGGDRCIDYCNDFSSSTGCASNAVWFKISTDAAASLMKVSFEADSDFIPLFRLLEDGCEDADAIIECTDGLDFSSVVYGNRDYYLEVSNQGTPGEFTLCVNTDAILAQCSSVFITPSRPENPGTNPAGPYKPGELIEFDCEVSFASDPIGQGNNCQWLQGIIPNIGPGWERDADLWTQGPANAEFFPRGVVNINVNSQNLGLETDALGLSQLTFRSGNPLKIGDALPPGWWFTSNATNCANDGTPNTMWGLPQGCGSEIIIDFSFSLKVKEQVDPQECLKDDYLKLEIFALADGMTGCWVSNSCGGDEPGRFDGEVDCDVGPTDNIFQEYPFLSGIVDVDDCEETVIEVYDRGSYSFIYVKTADSGILYFSDGTLYCRDGIGLDCREAYGLDVPTVVWNCDDGGGTGTQPDIVEDYPWITDYIDFDDCAGVSVELYDFGSQIFPYIITDDSAILYSNTGQLYCTSALPSFDCIQIYGLAAPVDVWTCDGGGGGGGTEPALFMEYPFLTDLIDPDDCEGGVEVYASGIYIFLFVTVDNVTTMYNSDGLRYCQDSPGFSCVDAYGFTQADLIDQWTCNGFTEEVLEKRSTVETENLVLYPNPTNGQVTISGLSADNIYPFEIYDYQGIKIQEGVIKNEQQLDISELASGVYFFKTLINNKIKVTRMIRM